MKKISLDLDALQVDSFSTAPAARPLSGTVHGHEATEGGAGCGTANYGSWCCWQTDTTCPGGEGGSYWCGGTDQCGDSHMASCGDECDITGIPYKCNNYTDPDFC